MNIKITLTLAPETRRLLLNTAQQFLETPEYWHPSNPLAFYVLQEWVVKSIPKIADRPKERKNIRVTRSQGHAIFHFFEAANLSNAPEIWDMERNALLNQICQQLPHLLNRSPV